MNGGVSGMGENRSGKYLTAAILAAIALGLFLYTLYAGLK
jgi:hypothetical protein